MLLSSPLETSGEIYIDSGLWKVDVIMYFHSELWYYLSIIVIHCKAMWLPSHPINGFSRSLTSSEAPEYLSSKLPLPSRRLCHHKEARIVIRPSQLTFSFPAMGPEYALLPEYAEYAP